MEMCTEEGEGMGGFSNRQTFDERGLSDPRLDTIGTVGLEGRENPNVECMI